MRSTFLSAASPGTDTATSEDAASSNRAAQLSWGLVRAMQRLDEAGTSVSDLLPMIPELVCELGFDRASLSSVHDDHWTVEAVFVPGDPDWSAHLTQVGRTSPQPLMPGRFETDVVRNRHAVLARDVDVEPWRAHPKLARLTGCRSYVAAPIVSGGAVIGILHGVRQAGDVDEADRGALLAFATSVQLALSRSGLIEELQSVYDGLQAASRAVDRAVGRSQRVPEVRVAPPSAAGVPESGAAVVHEFTTCLPSDVSLREREVLELVAAGMTNAAIARRLGIAESTVKQHLKNILRKLAVGSRAEAVAYWYAAGGPRMAGRQGITRTG